MWLIFGLDFKIGSHAFFVLLSWRVDTDTLEKKFFSFGFMKKKIEKCFIIFMLSYN